MQSSMFRVMSGLVTILLLGTLVAVIVLTIRTQPATVILPQPTIQSTATPSPTFTATATATVMPTVPGELGTWLRVPSGGFALVAPPGLDITAAANSVRLDETGTEPETALSIHISGGSPDELGASPTTSLVDIAEGYAQETLALVGMRFGTPMTTTLHGAEGVVLDLSGMRGTDAIAGRVFAAQPSPSQLLLMAASAPAEFWTTMGADRFVQVQESMRLFRPELRAVSTATPARTPRVTATAAVPAATPTPAAVSTSTPSPQSTVLPVPTATVAVKVPFQGNWRTDSNANVMNDLIVAGNTLWIASEGGALAWSQGSEMPVKFTSVDGLVGNRLTAASNCPLPGLGIIFGSDYGLQIVEPRAGGWKNLNSTNSDMRYDDVSSLYCDAENEFLVVGYAAHGLDIYDAAADEWRHLDRNSGLAANDVRQLAVVGDRDAIWAVAGEGITVAAGPESEFYTTDNSPLKANRVDAIATDGQGLVWIGGDGVLYGVDGDRWTVYDAGSVNDDEFPDRPITGLVPADNGTIWLGTVDGDICHFSPAQRRCLDSFRGAQGMAPGPLTAMALDGRGQVYYTTAGNGYSRLDGERWRSFVKRDEPLDGNRVLALAGDDVGNLWVASDGGIQRYSGDQGPGTRFNMENSGISPADVRTLYAALGGRMWIGGAGASYFDGDTWTTFTTVDGLPGDIVQAIVIDTQLRTWFGTEEGLSIWNGSLFFNLDESRGLPSADIRALLADGPAVWIGSQGGGLYRFESSQLQIFNQDNMGLPSNNVTALALTGDGDLLIGTDAGLALLQNDRLSQYDELSGVSVTALGTRAQEIWVAAAGEGVYYYDGEGWQRFTVAEGLPANEISSIYATDTAVWIGGENGGMVRLPK